MSIVRPLLAGAAAAFAASVLAREDAPARIPIEHFFRPPLISEVSISPDGKTVAGAAAVGKGEERGLVFIDLATMKPYPLHWQSGFDIYNPVWVSESNLLFQVGRSNAFVVGLYRVNRDNRLVVPLIGDDAVVQIVDPMDDDPNHALVWIPGMYRGSAWLAYLRKNSSAFSANLNRTVADTQDNQALINREEPPLGDIYQWTTDWNHEARIVLRFYGEKLEYLYRANRKAAWEPLPLDPEDWTVVGFESDNAGIYLAGYHDADTQGLYSYDPAAKTLGDLVFRDEFYDFTETASYKYFENTLIGMSYDRDVPTSVWFAAEVEPVQQMVDKLLPGQTNVIYDWSDDFKSLLVGSYSDVKPTEYFLLDLAKPQLRLITKAAPWLDGNDLAKTQVVRFATSDGLRLEGYLTLPQGGSAPYPMVCVVHGGPWARDTGGYDAETQFLANRGYAVLRVNYRGSTGFGRKISDEPDYEFRRMQDDITEAVQHVVAQGIADPERLAIMGASFGGYSALCGAAFWPDLYKCAVTIVGVFDWELMIKDRKRQRARYSHQQLLEKLGDPKVAQELFEAISPINHVDKIKIPIFIAHGKDDRNVSVRQSKLLERKLKQQGVEFETFYRAWEGHGFFDKKNRIELYERIEAFLEENLK